MNHYKWADCNLPPKRTEFHRGVSGAPTSSLNPVTESLIDWYKVSCQSKDHKVTVLLYSCNYLTIKRSQCYWIAVYTNYITIKRSQSTELLYCCKITLQSKYHTAYCTCITVKLHYNQKITPLLYSWITLQSKEYFVTFYKNHLWFFQ